MKQRREEQMQEVDAVMIGLQHWAVFHSNDSVLLLELLVFPAEL
jgi:hypothetical protein